MKASALGDWSVVAITLLLYRRTLITEAFFSLVHGIYSRFLLGIPSGTGSQTGMPLSQWESWHRGNREGDFEQGWGQGGRAGGASKIKDQTT